MVEKDDEGHNRIVVPKNWPNWQNEEKLKERATNEQSTFAGVNIGVNT